MTHLTRYTALPALLVWAVLCLSATPARQTGAPAGQTAGAPVRQAADSGWHALPDSAPVMAAGQLTATAGDLRALFGPQATPDSLTLSQLADYLLKLNAAYTAFGNFVPPHATDSLRRMLQAEAVFEIQQASTTARAEADTAGRRAFFACHAADYAWPEVHFIGTVAIAATPDSAAAAAGALRQAGVQTMSPREVVAQSIRMFGKDIMTVSVNVERGRNPFVDHAAFGAPAPPPDGRWRAAAIVHGDTLRAPRTAGEAGYRLTSDYADALHSAWLDSLRAATPVKLLIWLK